MSEILESWRGGWGLPDTLVIDGHVHVGPWPHGTNFESVQDMAAGSVAAMDANRVDAACVLGGGGFFSGTDYTLGNTVLIELFRRIPDRAIPFAHVNPNDEPGRITAELDRVYAEGVRCLKLINSYQQRYPGDGPNLMAVYAFAARHHMLILNHSWSNDEIARIAPQFPGLDFILGHYSPSRDPVLKDLPNVYASIWNLGALGFLERGIRNVGPEKFLFGSDAFMNPISVGIGLVVYADIPDDQKRLIMGLNQARLLDKVGALPRALRERYILSGEANEACRLERVLCDAAKAGKLCPFIGSGFSVPFGYPTWADLLRDIAADPQVAFKHIAAIGHATPLEVAEVLHYCFTDNKENWSRAKQRLRSQKRRATISPIHRELDKDFNRLCMGKITPDRRNRREDQIQKLKRLPELGATRLLTTNYDKVIEHEIYTRESIRVVVKEKDFSERLYCDLPVLVKLHGDVKTAERAVLTHTQYFDFIAARTSFNAFLQTTFLDYTVVFLGYTFRDLNIHHAHAGYLRDYGRAERFRTPAYMVVLTKYDKEPLRDYYPVWLKFLEAKNIVPMEYDGCLADFVEEYADKVRADTIA